MWGRLVGWGVVLVLLGCDSQSPPPIDAEVRDLTRYASVGVVQSADFDAGGNLWLLDGPRVGVLRPGDPAPTWTWNVGQSGRGLLPTTVCGGESGRAWVGYERNDREGGVDLLEVGADGTVNRLKHLSLRGADGAAQTAFSCLRRGRDVFFATDQGVVRFRSTGAIERRAFVAPRVLGWARDGTLLVAARWRVGLLDPARPLFRWERPLQPAAAGSHEGWRALAQTREGRLWFGSPGAGLWSSDPHGSALQHQDGIPTDQITALAAASDGGLYVGTLDEGLWRVAPDGTALRLEEVRGRSVRELRPAEPGHPLLVTTDAGLFAVPDGVP